jgi:hypothetical protein
MKLSGFKEEALVQGRKPRRLFRKVGLTAQAERQVNKAARPELEGCYFSCFRRGGQTNLERASSTAEGIK